MPPLNVALDVLLAFSILEKSLFILHHRVGHFAALLPHAAGRYLRRQPLASSPALL